MVLKKPQGIKGKRRVERIDREEINIDFILESDKEFLKGHRRIIETIYQMRVCTTSQLTDILGYHRNYILKMTNILYINRFLYRKTIPKPFEEKGSNEFYFMLDEAGELYLSGYYGVTRKEIKWSKEDLLIKYDKLKHSFEISETRAKIEVAARNEKHKIVNCYCDRHLYIRYTHEGNDLVLRPDMYFEYVDNKNRYKYFIEVDRGTVAITGGNKTNSFDKKIPYYESYRLSGDYKNRFNNMPRILVITTTTKRAEQLKDSCKEKSKIVLDILFTTKDLWREACTKEICINMKGESKTIFDD